MAAAGRGRGGGLRAGWTRLGLDCSCTTAEEENGQAKSASWMRRQAADVSSCPGLEYKGDGAQSHMYVSTSRRKTSCVSRGGRPGWLSRGNGGDISQKGSKESCELGQDSSTLHRTKPDQVQTPERTTRDKAGWKGVEACKALTCSLLERAKKAKKAMMGKGPFVLQSFESWDDDGRLSCCYTLGGQCSAPAHT